MRETHLHAVTALSSALIRATDPRAVGRALLESVVELLPVEVAALATIDENGRGGRGLCALVDGEDAPWWRDVEVDFDREPSAIGSAAFEAAPIVVFDVASSPIVNRRLAEQVGAKSAAFVPLVSGNRVPAVLIVASTGRPHVFEADDVAMLQALAAETALALERSRSASALADALARERLVAEVGRKVRSEHDLDDILRVAVEQAGRATGVIRCFIRLGRPGESMPIRAEWYAEGLAPIGGSSDRLAVSNLALVEERTVAIGDVRAARELEDPELGGLQALHELGTRAVLATPIVVFDRVIGVFAFHRDEATTWDPGEIALAETMAREVGLAIHTAQLLEENAQQLERQRALLDAAQVVSSELHRETVLQRLVLEVTNLLGADAADCYLLDAGGSILRCAAVNGLDQSLLGFEFAADRGLAGAALETGRSVLSNDYSEHEQPVPHPAYEEFTGAVVAPMTWAGEVRGVLGAGTRDPERQFDEADAEVLATFASLASLAVRNAASYEQSVRQARIQRGFFGIATALAEPLSQTATLDAVAQAATEALGGTAAAVLMPAGHGLGLAASYDLPPSVAEALSAGLPESASVLAVCADERRILAAPDLVEDDRFDEPWRAAVRDGALSALLAIPVDPPRRERGGIAIVFFEERREFVDDDLELARRLAGAARGALERSELYETERTSRSLSQQLARMSALLAGALDPTSVLDEVAEQAPALVGADACSIRILESDELVVRAVHGEGLGGTIGARSASTGTFDVLHGRAPTVLTDAEADPGLVADDPALSAGYRAYVGVPLLGAEGGTQGVLSVYQRRPRAWRDEEVEALAGLAANASAILANAELYQRVALERERSYAILANIADGIVAVDREGKVVLWNTAAEEITGVPAASALGRTPEQVIQRELSAGPDGPQGERIVSIRRGADEVWLSLTEAVMRDPAGAVAGGIFAFRDVSAERRVEQMKTDFVSTVSHELRAPLTSIYGFAETLLRRDVLFEETERQTFLGYVASEAQRLTGIVDTLLSVARLDAGDLQVDLAPTDVGAVVTEVVAAAKGDGHRFVVDVPPEPLAAAADAEKLRQVLSNLVENAVRFSPDGGTVTVEARRAGQSVELRVVDEGVGVPADERERIFRKFHRAEGSGRVRAGTGLGLFIARGLVAAMGGRIWVEPRAGGGSSFAFDLPLAGDPVRSKD